MTQVQCPFCKHQQTLRYSTVFKLKHRKKARIQCSNCSRRFKVMVEG